MKRRFIKQNLLLGDGVLLVQNLHLRSLIFHSLIFRLVLNPKTLKSTKNYQMKQLIFFLFFLPIITSAQEFSFELYFEDALGNRDTLVLGYDPLATDSIDVSFGEENIIAQPWDSVFEVRISDYYDKNQVGEQVSFNSKKCIQNKSSQPYFLTNRIEIDIHAKYLPIRITCDSTDLESPERRGTFITSMLPGGWFDTGGFVTNLFYNPQTLIDLAGFESWPLYPFNYYYLEASDSVYVCWSSIADSNVNTSNVYESEKENTIIISPNPVSSNENITINAQGNYTIVDIQGKTVQNGTIENNSVQLIKVENGIYFFILENENAVYKTKFVVR